MPSTAGPQRVPAITRERRAAITRGITSFVYTSIRDGAILTDDYGFDAMLETLIPSRAESRRTPRSGLGRAWTTV
jgi:hypothetical protein